VALLADHHRAGLQTGWVRSYPCVDLLQPSSSCHAVMSRKSPQSRTCLNYCLRSPWAAFSQLCLGLGYLKRCNASAGAKTSRSLNVL
jgi:hypothetical protein